jgi:branched-chain amino acid transport system permease protein
MTADARSEVLVARRRIKPPSALSMVGLAIAALILAWLVVNFVKAPSYFYSLFLIGFTKGMYYGLIALGYSLVYGILELINFAHGDVFMLGSMMSATIVGGTVLGLTAGSEWYVLWPGIVLALLVAMVFCGTLNASIERVAYRRLRNAPRLAPLITAIGMSFILQNAALIWKGARPISTRDLLPHSAVFTIGGKPYRWDMFIVLLITLPVLVLLTWLVQRTKQGKAMRATAQDREAAAMMGVDVDRTISFTFALAGTLAGVAGLVFSLYTTNTVFTTGFTTGLIAFTAAVLGGIGNLPGAVLGALVIGLVQAFSDGLQWHAPGAQWTQAIVFAVLILILVVRPEGLLGERTPEGG